MSNIKVWGEEEPEDVKVIKKEKKPKIKQVKQKKEREPLDLNFLWLIITPILLLFVVFSIIPIMSSITDDLIADVTGEYIVEIFIPDCENGYLFLERYNVLAQYLLDNGLGVRKGIFDGELKPSDDFAAWDRYVNSETGSPIPSKNICVNMELMI